MTNLQLTRLLSGLFDFGTGIVISIFHRIGKYPCLGKSFAYLGIYIITFQASKIRNDFYRFYSPERYFYMTVVERTVVQIDCICTLYFNIYLIILICFPVTYL